MAASGYQLWNVIAGEQPTSAKWNILGTNDASFNSGVGFNDSAIVSRHISNNYKGMVYLAGSQTTGTSGFFKILPDAVSYNTGACWDTTNKRFTAPVAGTFHFSAGVLYQSSGSGQHHIITLYKNSAEVARLWEGAMGDNSNHQISGSRELLLAVGDYIESWGYSSTNYTVGPGTPYTYLSWYFVAN